MYPIHNGQATGSEQGVGVEGEHGAVENGSKRDGGEIKYDEESHEDQELGERPPRVGRRPDTPTKKEIEDHFPLHVHFRAWCPHCQAGKSTSKQHRQSGEDEVLGPCVSLDYAFKYDDDKEEAVSPVLVAVDKGTGAIWALEVDKKGVSDGVGAKWLVDKLNVAGYHGMKVTLMSDQEPSMLALKNAIAMLRTSETAFVESTVRQSKCNGRVERAIRNWRDQYRTLRHFLEHRMKEKMKEGSALSTWLVTWSAEVINKYRIQPSGRTAYEQMTGHRCKHAVVGFGEKVFFQHTEARKDDYRKDVGVFLGVGDRDSTYLVGTKDGVYASPQVIRMVDDDSYDVDLLRQIEVRYYDYINDGVKAPPVVIARGVGCRPNPDTAPIPAAGGEYAPRRLKILKQYFERHGYTAGCPGCIGARDGVRRGGHTEECRARIEQHLGEQKSREQDRITEWLASKEAEGAKTSEIEDTERKAPADSERQSANAIPMTVDDGPDEPHPQASGSGDPVPTQDTMDSQDEVILEDGPTVDTRLRNRVASPLRAPATKRKPDRSDEEKMETLRQIIDTPGNTPPRRRHAGGEDEMTVDEGRQDQDAAAEGEAMRDGLGDWYDSNEGNPDAMSSLSNEERNILAAIIRGVDVTEVFSPERVNKLASRFGLVPGASMDLTTGYDFNLEADRRKAWKEIKKSNPYVIIGSPPCTMFSNLQELNKYVHRDNPEWLARFEEEKRKASRHIEFCIQLYRYQLRQGRHFIHEHPWGASSWKMDSVVELMRDGRVFTVESHQCRFGLESHVSSKSGAKGPVKKPTGFMTSARCVAERLGQLCDGTHSHVHLVGGRAAAAQIYPDGLCQAILEGIVAQKAMEKQGRVSSPVMNGPQLRRFMGSIGLKLGGVSIVVEQDGKHVPLGN